MGTDSLSKLMMYYADLVGVGTLHYLVELMAEKEGVSKREMFEKLGISRGTLYQKSVGTETKEKIITEAFKRLDTDKVVEILYESIKSLYVNFLIDVLSAYEGKEVKTIVEENSSLLKTVRDLERRQIVEQVTKKRQFMITTLHTTINTSIPKLLAQTSKPITIPPIGGR